MDATSLMLCCAGVLSALVLRETDAELKPSHVTARAPAQLPPPIARGWVGRSRRRTISWCMELARSQGSGSPSSWGVRLSYTCCLRPRVRGAARGWGPARVLWQHFGGCLLSFAVPAHLPMANTRLGGGHWMDPTGKNIT